MKNYTHTNTTHKYFIKSHSHGMSIIEVIVAMALFIILASVGMSAVLGAFSSNRLSDDHLRAQTFAQSGIEEVSSLIKQGWSSPFLATNCNLGCGVTLNNGNLTWAGTSNTQGNLTRTITVESVLRNASGNIVTTGGTIDSDTKKVTSTVSWDFSPTRNNIVSISRYFTQFMKNIIPPIGDWLQPSIAGSINLNGNQNGLAVTVQGNYAYIVRNGGNPRFAVVDISTPASPSLVGSLPLSSASNTQLYMQGNFAYLAGTQNTNEILSIDVSNPAAPIEVGTFNTPGNSNATSIYVSNSTAYVTSQNSGNPELYILDVSNPASLSQLGSLDLNGSASRVIVTDNYAFITSTNNTQEIQVVSISNSTTPSLIATLNLPGNTDPSGLSLIQNYLYTAQGSVVHSVDISTPTNPTLAASLDIGGSSISDISYSATPNNKFLFMGTLNNSTEFVVLDILDPVNLSLATSVNISGNSLVNGLSYSDTHDIVVAVSSNNSQEIIIFEPN